MFWTLDFGLVWKFFLKSTQMYQNAKSILMNPIISMSSLFEIKIHQNRFFCLLISFNGIIDSNQIGQDFNQNHQFHGF